VRIAATRVFPGPAWAELADVVVGHRADAEVLIVMNEPVPFDELPDLRLVANFSVGYDNVDLDECRRRGIAVTNTPGVVDVATADLAFGLMLAARRRIVEGDRAIRAGTFRLPDLGREVTGATLAIVGLGRIGSAVARRATAFDMRVLGVRSSEGDLDAALREADIVSVHVPLNGETRGLISRERLASMQDGATLVNTARGAVVDERALIAALRDGVIAGAALDVHEHEPAVAEELLARDNVVVTPHIASATRETRHAMGMLAVSALRAVLLDGRTPPNVVA